MPHRLLLLVALLLAGCAAAPVLREPSERLPTAHSPLAQRVEALAQAHPAGHSGFRLLASSTDAFTARAEMIRAARVSLDLQYYIVDDGLTTRALADELLRAADRGVRVRLLLDDTASDGSDAGLALLAAHPNIQVRVFNPVYLGRATGVTRLAARALDLPRQHRRMHNKLLLADGVLPVVGGRNLGDAYFDAEQAWNFMDIDLLGAGPVAAALGQSFDAYWNHALSQPIERFLRRLPDAAALAEARRGIARYFAEARITHHEAYARLMAYRYESGFSAWLGELVWAPGQALWDAPDKLMVRGEPPAELLLLSALWPVLQGAREELVFLSAYFVPLREGVAFLTGEVRRGLEVAVLTNALEATDVPLVHGGYAPYREALLTGGVRLHELRRQPGEEPSFSVSGDSESSLHSKAAVIDRRWVFVGSLNFDPRSILWNSETGLLVDSPELARQVHALTAEGLAPAISYEVRLETQAGRSRLAWHYEDDGQPRRLVREPGGRWRQFNAWLARLFRLERLL